MAAAIEPLFIRKTQLVIANLVDVAFFDAARVDSLALVLDPVGAAEVFYVKRAALKDHRGVPPRDIAVFDGQIGGLCAPSDDELFFVNGDFLSVEDHEQRRQRPCDARNTW